MSANYLLGLDIGTSGCKGVLADLDGNIQASCTTKHAMGQPQPGWAEHDPELNWWGEMVTIIRHCLEVSRVNPKAIQGIAVGGLVPNLCPLDSRGQVVRPAILYRDNRAVAESTELSREFGLQLGTADVTPKLYWLKRHEPENYRKTSVVLNAHSYLVYKLTGNYSADCDTANIFGGVFDLDKLTWREDLVTSMGLNPAVLPPVYLPTAVVGQVTPAAAAATGLAPGIPVVAGNGDSFMSLLGAGVVDPGEAMIYFGTAGTLLACLGKLEKVAAGPAISRGNVQFIANILTGGELTRWFREHLHLAASAPDYGRLESLAGEIPPGSERLIILPHLMGTRTPEHNPLARGTFLGLTTAHTGAHLYRALMESFGYALRHSYEENPVPITRLVATGGGAKSLLWRKIIADILGTPLAYSPKSDTALGSAYFAGFALGIFPDFSRMKHQWLQEETTAEVSPEAHELYNAYYQLYQDFHSLVQPIFAPLARLPE